MKKSEGSPVTPDFEHNCCAMRSIASLGRAVAAVIGVAGGVPLLIAPPAAQAQDAPAAPAAEKSVYVPEDNAPPPTPALESKAPKKKYWNDINNSFFVGRIGAAVLLDGLAYSQNATNKEQVGAYKSKIDWRAERLTLGGKFKTGSDSSRWLRFLISPSYNGLERPPDSPAFALSDLALTYPTGKWNQVTLGKQREGVQLELMGVASTFTFMERATASVAFQGTRNDGIRYYGQTAKGRATYSLGYFNSFLTNGLSYSDSGSQVAGRISLLPQDAGDRLLTHAALGIRYSEDKKGMFRYKAKPEDDSVDNIIDTKDFKAKDSLIFSAENAIVRGSFAFRAEGLLNRVAGTDSGDVWLHGYYVDFSYFLTGEHRKYDRSSGSFGRVAFNPERQKGAWEIGLRNSNTNLNAKSIRGGRFNRSTLALSYFQDTHWRYEFNYGYGQLDRFEKKGNLHFFQARLQYEL